MAKQSKSQKLLELLIAAGPAGILNSDLAANSAIGWGFASVVRDLRRAGHDIGSQHCGQVYRTILLKAAPAPEQPPLFALMAAKNGAPRA
jgi:hypothetical protein